VSKTNLAEWVATVGNIGRIPVAPGTWGSVAVLKRGSKPWQMHVTFCVGWQSLGSGTLWGLGGNQSNSVTISKFPFSDVLTWRWPLEIL